MKPIKTIVVLLVLSLPSIAQEISGNVVSQRDGAPLAYAHIVCPESGEATMTDEDGAFALTFKDITTVKTIVASHVGYKPSVKTILPSVLQYALTLQEDTTYLHEVEVRPLDPVVLLRQAINRLPANHGGKRILTCFYRMVTKNQDKYIQLSEASFQLYQVNGANELKLLRARETEDKDAFNGIGMGIGTPVSAAKNLDITQDISDSFLGRSLLKKHTFVYEGVTLKNGIEVHEISFDQKDVRQALYSGKIYLDVESLAFVSVDYRISAKGITYVKAGTAAERAAMKLLDITIDVMDHATTLNYRQYGNKWYLHYVRHTEDVRVKSKRYNFDVPVTDRSEYLVTRIDTVDVEHFPEAKYTRGTHLESASDTTSTFWENYNIIPTTIPYDAIAREIQQRNGYQVTKEEMKARVRKLPKDPAIRVDSVLSFYHRKGLFNGQTLIKYNGKVILHRGYGYADKARQIANDTNTVFRIGSIAKTFTSRIIFSLQDEGLLEYNDTIQRFLPWYPHKGITIHHLLTHTSGIPNYTDNASYIDSIAYDFPLESLVRRFGAGTPYFAPGSTFRYSNTGYTILALISEKASGKPFSDLIQERVTKPLQLTHTSFGTPPDTNIAVGYWNNMREPYYVITNTAGAGAICSNASDLLKWDEAHDDPHFDILFQPREWYHDWGSHYGYGWNIDKYQFFVSKKHIIHYHGGTDFGFKSMLARQPDRKNLVVLLNNAGDFPLFDITDIVFDILN